MTQEIIKPKIRGFISLTAHPSGCKRLIMDQINSLNVASNSEIKNVLVIGSSMGYGLSSTITSLFGLKASVLGVCYERQPVRSKTGSAGWYNSGELLNIANENNLNLNIINGDAFANKTKEAVSTFFKESFEQIDLLIYSLASPRRYEESTGITWNSALKPIGKSATFKSINLQNYQFETITMDPASNEEINSTSKVMGGEDWESWIEYLLNEKLLSENFKTVAFSYMGPQVTEQIYRSGTIGKAKQHLESTVVNINTILKNFSSKSNAIVSVNKALVTQASSAIPGVPLYLSMLIKLMKDNDTNESALQQIGRLFNDKGLLTNNPLTDSNNLIRLDDYELDPVIQHDILENWIKLNDKNFTKYIDIDQYISDFHQIFGFNVDSVDYDLPVEIDPDYTISNIS
jgi:enoyl-[acyl-carrier protein] reductase/trans-2-enoyl-CoA reductase (NAD+)|tara:strand:+ start:2720 stop:3928 length:1209 start_codon:yes stop_codon:yes gene_type:complete